MTVWRAKKVLEAVYLDDMARAAFHSLKRISRLASGTDSAISRAYFASNQARKLHIGCGGRLLNGWLNSDFMPSSARVLHLDARSRFPFEDESFDFVYSEHVIEHLAYGDGTNMLAECFRVLRTGGVIRLATPDLASLIRLYHEPKTDIQLRYIRWAATSFTPFAPAPLDTFVINNLVRAWDHLFIYDEKTLSLSMETAGFRSVSRRGVQESPYPELCDLECEANLPDGFYRLESMVLEGRKER